MKSARLPSGQEAFNGEGCPPSSGSRESIVFVTTCSNRKRLPSSPALRAETLPTGALSDVVAEWLGRVASASTKAAARDIYCGRGFQEANQIWTKTRGQPWIVSAGLGLINGDEQIPSYGLTLAPEASDCIARKVDKFSAGDWWAAINAPRGTCTPLSTLVREGGGELVVIALSEPYARLIGDDLQSLSSSDLRRLRIVGPRQCRYLPERLRPLVMPYSDHLDGPGSDRPGTAIDFPQRAARHFIENIAVSMLGAEAEIHWREVAEAMEKLPGREVIKRIACSDDEIKEIVWRHWDRAEGRSGRMLRLLRDELGVACEQGRFARLFRSAAKEVTDG